MTTVDRLGESIQAYKWRNETCRRTTPKEHCSLEIAAMAELTDALQEKGIDSLTVVNTPIERARLYFRYHPLPNLLAASDPERVSHRAFGLPNLEFTESETEWPR